MSMKKLKCQIEMAFKRFLAAIMIAVLGLGFFTAMDIYYDYSPNTVHAAGLAGMDTTITKPVWNSENIPARDTSGEVIYYYAGNGFNALNQLNDGVKQPEAGTDGHLKIASNCLIEKTYNGAKAVSGSGPDCSGFTTYSQRTDIDFDKTWELMDTDAIWDDQYLFAQYQKHSFGQTTSAFAPDILNTVNSWYDEGFSYDGTQNSRPTIIASGKSWFSDAEKIAVKGAEVKTDGNEGSANTTTGDILIDAKLFAPSIDEMYYNPLQIERLVANLVADKSDIYNSENYRRARSFLWSRSFWGVGSTGIRYGFNINSEGKVFNSYTASHVADECAVAPAFYLDLEKIIMARSAQAGSKISTNAALTAYDPNSISGDIKFLLQDKAFASSFTSSINGKSTCNIVAGNTYSVDYSGAVTTAVNEIGTDNNGKLVISAAIYDSEGKVLYYGPLAAATKEKGTVNITIPFGLIKGNVYTLALFEEQLGGTSTYLTKNNSNNGTSFTQENGGEYINYETDYMSGSVAYMKLAVSDEEFDVTINDDAILYAGSTYSARDIDELVSVTVGANALTTGEYYVMTKDVYKEVGLKYADVTTSTLVNKIVTAENPGNEKTTLDLIFVYYPSKNGIGQVVERTFTVEADKIEGTVDFDSHTWYQSTENNITWNYKLNGNGEIIGLYTEDSIVPIVDGGGTLNIPSKVAGRVIVAVGGGTEETPVIPASETSWTSVSFPSTVTTINDYAFYNTKAMAFIVVPSTITKIGMKAFYMSSITGIRVDAMNGTIGSLAFGGNYSLMNVTLKGGTEGLTISTIAFRDSGAQSVTVKGNVSIHKNAFKNNTRLSKISISGNVNVGEYAFTGCTAVDHLSISGKVKIAAYAFNNLTSLTQLYLPSGTTVAEYAFNGCSSLAKLESDVDLVSHIFEGCSKINTVILDEHVTKVEYDWEGHAGTYENRKVYVKSKNTSFEFYGKDDEYISAFGSAGQIIVYVPNDATVDEGPAVVPSDNIMSLKGYTCYAHKGNYDEYITGKSASVTLYSVNNIETQMSGDGISNIEIGVSEKQTGIEAYYNGVILTTKDIKKSSMTVVPMFGSDEGDRAYVSDAFYIIRTTEFNALESAKNVTESEVSSYEPVHAEASDLTEGQETGTISVTVIVFYKDGEMAKYFSTPVSIRVEEYNAKSFVEQEYGSYENIAEKLATLTEQLKQLEATIASLEADKETDADTIRKLQEELNGYKAAYEKLVEVFSQYTTNNKVDSSGYFGTISNSSGKQTEVVYINGNATVYEKTDVTTSDHKTIYKAQYDTNGDGVEETIYFYVDKDGVHLTDADGKPTGTVYTDTLGAIERRTAALLLEIKKTLESCESGLSNIIAALKDAGYDIDSSLDVDEQYKQIVSSIRDMADKILNLEDDLKNANASVTSYENALASIYSLLTGSTLEADDITGINNTLIAITGKIQSLQNSLQIAQATVKDLQSKLEQAESAKSELAAELETTKSQLTSANAALKAAEDEKNLLIAEYEKAIADGDEEAASKIQEQIAEKQSVIKQLQITQQVLSQKEKDILEAQDAIVSLQSQMDAKNKEIADLKTQLEALSNSADGFAMTVKTANALFGLTLNSDATNEEVYDAIVGYVKDKVSTDETIAAIQRLVNSQNTGTALVKDVEKAIAESTAVEGMIDDKVVDPSSNNYKSGYTAGYDKGYQEGKKAGTVISSGSTNSNDASTIASLSAQVSSLTSSNNLLQNKVDKLENKIEDLEKDKDELKDKNSSLSSQVSSLSSENAALSDKINTLTTENKSLSKDLSSLQTQFNRANETKKETVAETTVTNKKEEESSDQEKKSSLTDDVSAETVKAEETQIIKPDVLVSTSLSPNGGNVLGTTHELIMPSESRISVMEGTQKGIGAYLKLANGNALLSTIETNAKYANNVTEESLNNAYKIMEYYANHLKELGELGSAEISKAADDDSKVVLMETVVSADIVPSTTQETAIKNGVDTKVSISFEGIENGALYFIIHESDVRSNKYDVLLTEAFSDGTDIMVEFSLPDLSPVTIAKVTIDDISAIELTGEYDMSAEEMQNVTESSNNGLRIVTYVLIIIAFIIIVGVVVYLKFFKKAFGNDEE